MGDPKLHEKLMLECTYEPLLPPPSPVDVEYVGASHYRTLNGRWEMRMYSSCPGPAGGRQGWCLRLDGNSASDTNHKSLLHARMHVAALQSMDMVPPKGETPEWTT